MSNVVKTTRRTLVSLSLPKPVPALLMYAQNMVDRMTGNPFFANPVPLLATILAAIAGLQAAEAAALSRIKGAATARNDKRKTLVALLEQLRTYIQTIADADESNGPAIIESAGVAIRKMPTRKPRVFAAKQGATSGVATLVAASAGRRVSYEWQCSTDGGKTWVLLPPTLQAKTSVPGVAPGTVAQFKYRPVTKTGAADWSPAVSLTVL